MNTKRVFVIAALLSLTAVILGAFGAHSLREVLPTERLESFETGVRYQFYHSFALFLTGLFFHHFPGGKLKLASWFFLLGVILFSGSIYLLSCRDLLGIASWSWLGPITPIGGLSFMIGWGLLSLHFFSFKKQLSK
jgi:uncharacterized membrane protein YgdD (TMEM256/DUF423 family)